MHPISRIDTGKSSRFIRDNFPFSEPIREFLPALGKLRLSQRNMLAGFTHPPGELP
jgi:hypothetical protein